MYRILVIGYDPDSVDYDEPGLPAGLDREKVWAAALESLEQIRENGWEGIQCMVRPDKTAAIAVERALSETWFDCIVIGGGVRLSNRSTPVFETIVNTIRRFAPRTPLAFNTSPAGSLEAAQRWLKPS